MINNYLKKWMGKIFPPKPQCTHPNLRERKWMQAGTPMVTLTCPDCGFRDSGHVYADPQTWN